MGTYQQRDLSNSLYSEKYSSNGRMLYSKPSRPAEAKVRINSDSMDMPAGAGDARLEEEIVRWIPQYPVELETQRRILEKPVAIPQIDIGSRLEVPMPFTRAYSPVLRAHDIEQGDFMAFIDNLAVALAASPPFQALDVVGMGIGFVPHHWFQLASFGVSAAAGLGTAAVCWARTKRYLERVNREYFAPRGLKVSLRKDTELARLVGFPQEMTPLVSVNSDMEHISIRDRRIQAILPYISPLSFDVPPPAGQANILDKLSAKQIEAKISGNEKKLQKERQKRIEKEGKRGKKHNEDKGDREGYSSDQSSILSLQEEVRKVDRKIQKINARAEEKLLSKGPKKAADIEDKRAEAIVEAMKERDKRERELAKRQTKAGRKARAEKN